MSAPGQNTFNTGPPSVVPTGPHSQYTWNPSQHPGNSKQVTWNPALHLLPALRPFEPPTPNPSPPHGPPTFKPRFNSFNRPRPLRLPTQGVGGGSMSCIDAGSEARSAGQETHSTSQETRPGSQEKPQESPGLVAILENRVACNEARANGAETLLRVNEARWELTNDRLKKADGQLKAHKEMLYQLRARSEPEREMIFWMIKQGQEAESILNQIADRHFLLQLGPVPDTRLSYDFPYMPHMPKYILTTPDNEYLTSAIYEVTARQRIRTPGVHQPIHRIPYHAAEIVEPLLDVARPAQWTAIVVDPKVYRRLLSLYFLHDYMSNPVFHKDVFLHDLASGRRGGFCSSVLVNAILAKACHCHAQLDGAKFWVPWNLGNQFLREAQRLWTLELAQPKPDLLTTVQAGVILDMTCWSNGMDDVSRRYLERAVVIAENLRLFERVDGEEKLGADVRCARAFTAWGLLVWQAARGFYFSRRPLIEFGARISNPLPTPESAPWFYGEFQLRYPDCPTPFPARFGHTFRALINLRGCINEIATKMFNPAGGIPTPLSWDELELCHSLLERWIREMPDVLQPRNLVFPWQLKIHMEAYALIFRLYQSRAEILSKTKHLLDQEGVSRLERCRKQMSHAINRHETLTRLYYLRHGFERHDSFLTYHLAFLGYWVAIEATDNADAFSEETLQDMRATVVLCLKGLRDQGRSSHLADASYRHMLPRLQWADFVAARAHASVPTLDQDGLTDHVMSRWPLPVLTLHADPAAVTLGNLAATDRWQRAIQTSYPGTTTVGAMPAESARAVTAAPWRIAATAAASSTQKPAAAGSAPKPSDTSDAMQIDALVMPTPVENPVACAAEVADGPATTAMALGLPATSSAMQVDQLLTPMPALTENHSASHATALMVLARAVQNVLY